MKNILTLLIFVGLLGCQEEQILTGKLEVKFSNPSELSDNVRPKIYGLENPDYPLFEDLNIGNFGVLTKEDLNFGNYIFEYSRKVTFGNEIVRRQGFQISPDKTTFLFITL